MSLMPRFVVACLRIGMHARPKGRHLGAVNTIKSSTSSYQFPVVNEEGFSVEGPQALRAPLQPHQILRTWSLSAAFCIRLNSPKAVEESTPTSLLHMMYSFPRNICFGFKKIAMRFKNVYCITQRAFSSDPIHF